MQAIAIDDNNAAQVPTFIDAWLAIALGKEGPQPHHPLRQPEQVPHHAAACLK
jgi:hypothetical protein